MSSSKKGQIESAKIVIGEVFSRFWFRIPDYQRAYVWGKDEISELIDDVNYASEHNPEGQYFLGSMVLRKATRTTDGVSFEEYELLDGQQRLTTLDISAQDKPGFTPFMKTTPDGAEVWFSHKLADAVSCRSTQGGFDLIDTVPLGMGARPNHVEFVRNARGSVVYASLARIDDGGPGGVASSPIAIIDRSAPGGQRKVVGTFSSRGRESHGLWTNPENTLLYVAHEQDELPGTPNAGQTVCSAFDVSDPLRPTFIAQIPLGNLTLPSGALRNKKSINLVYVRVGEKGQTA